MLDFVVHNNNICHSDGQNIIRTHPGVLTIQVLLCQQTNDNIWHVAFYKQLMQASYAFMW